MLLTLADFAALSVGKSLVWLMLALPERFARYVAQVILWCALAAMPRLRCVGQRNLELVFPYMSESQRREILRRSFVVLARNILGFARIPLLSRESAADRVEPGSLALFRRLADEARHDAAGPGILFVTPHFGSFETIGQLSPLLYRPVSILARGFGLPRFDRWWNTRRELFGNRIFGRKGGYQQIVSRLKKGEDVLVLFDQNVKANHATFVDLFGIKAATTKSIAIAALRTGAPVVFTCGVEVSTNFYCIITERIHYSAEEFASSEEAVQAITQRVASALERAVKAYPENWFWIHRRFKTRPPGERENLYSC